MISLLYRLKEGSIGGEIKETNVRVLELTMENRPGIPKTWIKIYKQFILEIRHYATAGRKKGGLR